MDEIFPFSQISERTRKADLIKIFKIPKSSFYELVGISQWHQDFENDYPSCNGAPIVKAKLSRYQAWMVFHLNKYRIELGIPLKQLKDLLSNQTELSTYLSKESYLKEYAEQ